MHLSKLHLNNFRSFSSETVHFEESLSVLVGENNGGKSNIIDAIRLISSPLSGRRELFCSETDIRFGTPGRTFEIEATFQELTPAQQGRLLSATADDTLLTATFGLTYDATGIPGNIRPKLWAGRFKDLPEPGAHDMIRHVYLPPLRDAKRALSSGNPTRIYALLNHFLGDRDPEDVAIALARPNTDQILTDVNTAVTTGLEVLTGGVRQQNSTLGFNPDERLIDIARDLRFKLADQGIVPEDLRYSGHGFANLLYIATIAVELEKTESADLTVFLVEEPEAHLHPQLQAAVLNFLEERAQDSLSSKEDEDAPAGHLQVIVATHSPNLSAWVPNQSIVFVRTISIDGNDSPSQDARIQDGNTNAAEAVSEQPPFTRSESRCIPLTCLGLTETDRRKIDRYLDVTKSSLLFGGRVLLVEGIAEAILFPVIAKHYVLRDRPDKLRIFRSAVFVPIDGVDFSPYATALMTVYNGIRIADRLVIVTDGDQHTEYDGDVPPGQKRKKTLCDMATRNDAIDVFDVITNTYSLESELVISGNGSCMKQIFEFLHPRSMAKWESALSKTGDAQAKSIQELFRSTPKGDFAHLLAEKLPQDSGFVVPPYIEEAIEAIVK